MAGESLDGILQSVREAAEGAGALVVEAVLTAEKEHGALVAALEYDDFLKLMHHCAPKVIYLHTETFGAEEAALEEIDPTGNDDVHLANTKLVKSLVKSWKSKDGTLSMVLASFAVDNILHVLLECPPWLDDFQQAAEAVSDELEQEKQEHHELGMKEMQRTIKEKAGTLLKNPLFNASPRTSREKRIYLAKELFPETSDAFILQIVDEAINMDWFNGGVGSRG